MNISITVTQKKLSELLLNIAVCRPVFIWGPPGIGKSTLVQQFADSLGMPCVSLLGSQLAPEDIMGVPQIIDGVSQFCPPKMIARKDPYCLFLDELNACTQEVQKAFYSLIQISLASTFKIDTRRCLSATIILCFAINHVNDFRVVIVIKGRRMNLFLRQEFTTMF